MLTFYLICEFTLRTDELDRILVDLERPFVGVVDAAVPGRLEAVAVVCAPCPDVVTSLHQVGDEYGSVSTDIIATVSTFVVRVGLV